MSDWWATNQAARQADSGGGRGTPASIGRRIAGAIIDSILVFLVVGYPLVKGAMDAAADGVTYEPSAGLVVMNAVVALLYGVLPIALWGRTAGMFLVGIQVVAWERPGPPGWNGAFIRYLVYSLFPLYFLRSAVPVELIATVWAIVILVSILNDPMKRGLHDKAGGTFVRMR